MRFGEFVYILARMEKGELPAWRGLFYQILWKVVEKMDTKNSRVEKWEKTFLSPLSHQYTKISQSPFKSSKSENER